MSWRYESLLVYETAAFVAVARLRMTDMTCMWLTWFAWKKIVWFSILRPMICGYIWPACMWLRMILSIRSALNILHLLIEKWPNFYYIVILLSQLYLLAAGSWSVSKVTTTLIQFIWWSKLPNPARPEKPGPSCNSVAVQIKQQFELCIYTFKVLKMVTMHNENSLLKNGSWSLST